MKGNFIMVAQALLIKAGVNFASSFLQGKAEQNEYEKKAQLALQNAQTYRQNAQNIRLSGARNEDALRSQKRATIASASAAAGEAGMGESPTTTTALATTSSALEQNILNERFKTESEAENYLYQALIEETNAKQYKKEGQNRFSGNLLSGLSSSLSSLF